MHQSQPLRLYPTGGHFAAKCGGHFKTENGGQLHTKSWGSITHEMKGSIWTEYPHWNRVTDLLLLMLANKRQPKGVRKRKWKTMCVIPGQRVTHSQKLLGGYDLDIGTCPNLTILDPFSVNEKERLSSERRSLTLSDY